MQDLNRGEEEVNLQQNAFVLSDNRLLRRRGYGGHTIRPLASPKAVTLTNSPGHNATLAQFVFFLHYVTDTKERETGKDLSNVPPLPARTKLYFSPRQKRTDLFFL